MAGILPNLAGLVAGGVVFGVLSQYTFTDDIPLDRPLDWFNVDNHTPIQYRIFGSDGFDFGDAFSASYLSYIGAQKVFEVGLNGEEDGFSIKDSRGCEVHNLSKDYKVLRINPLSSLFLGSLAVEQAFFDTDRLSVLENDFSLLTAAGASVAAIKILGMNTYRYLEKKGGLGGALGL